MTQEHKDVTEAELAILQFLWEAGKASIREIVTRLYPPGNVSQYATVQKLLERLEAKECVQREKDGKVHYFEAIIDQNELIGRRLQAMTEQLGQASLVPLLTQLVQFRKLSTEERNQLRQLIDLTGNVIKSKKKKAT